MFFDRGPPWGRCRQIRHPRFHWLVQKKGRGGQEGDAGQQVCPQGPSSPLLPHPQQPHPHGSTGPGGVEISFCLSWLGCLCWHMHCGSCMFIQTVLLVMQMYIVKVLIVQLCAFSRKDAFTRPFVLNCNPQAL